MSNMLRIAALFVLVLCASLSCAQLVPPGGETPPTHVSGQWWDPASWQITATAAGEVRNKSWVYNENQEVVPFNQTFSWQQAQYYGRCHNSTYVNKNIETESEGTVTFNLQYIGTAPLQDKILVLIDSTAIALASNFPNGNYIVDNGIGSPPIPVRGSFYAQGQKYRLVQIGSNGQGSFQIELYAKANTSGMQASAEVFTHAPTVVIADKAIVVNPWLGATYHAKPVYAGTHEIDWIPEANDLSDLTDYYIDTVIQESGNYFFYGHQASHGLFGNWENPMYHTFLTSQGSPYYDQFSRTFTVSEMVAIILGNTPERDIEVRGVDSQATRFGYATVRMHAPLERPERGPMYRAYGGTIRISSEMVVLPGQTFTPTVTTTMASSVTQGITFNAGVGIKLSEAIALSLGVSPSNSETASISFAVSTSTTYTNNTNRNMVCFLTRTAFWREGDVRFQKYGQNGFLGTELGKIIIWESGSKQAAELYDYRDEISVAPQGNE